MCSNLTDSFGVSFHSHLSGRILVIGYPLCLLSPSTLFSPRDGTFREYCSRPLAAVLIIKGIHGTGALWTPTSRFLLRHWAPLSSYFRPHSTPYDTTRGRYSTLTTFLCIHGTRCCPLVMDLLGTFEGISVFTAAEPPSWLGLGTAMIHMNQESLVGASH